MRLAFVPLVAVPFASLSACRSSAPALPPLAPLASLREVDVRYRAELAPERGVEPTKGEPAAPAPEASAPAKAAPSAALVRFECELHALDARDALALSPTADPAPFGRVVSSAELDRATRAWSERDASERRTSPSLQLESGKTGTIAVLAQTSFVQGFTIESTNGGMIGDPRIEVAQEGVRVEATPRLADDGSVVLDVVVRASQILHPLEEASVCFPGTRTAIGLQMPIAFAEEMGASTALRENEALVLGPFAPKDEKRLVAVVRARRAAPEVALAR